MNISYRWLKELIDLELSPKQVSDELTRVGLAVEGIHEHGVDSVFDIDLTSNRPDCLSHLGIARELGVITAKPLNERADTHCDVPMPAVLFAPWRYEYLVSEKPESCVFCDAWINDELCLLCIF